MTAIEKLLARHKEAGGLSDEFTPLEKAVLYWYLKTDGDCSADEAVEELEKLYG